MKPREAESFQTRTDAKLRYARLHLDELANHEPLGGDDFDRAHQESFLFHLLGVQGALLAELNAYYLAGVAPDSLTPGTLRNALKEQGRVSAELSELYNLEQDSTSWYCQAKNMRDHSTHQTGVSRAFHLGGENDRKVFLREPRSERLIERHFPLAFRDWLNSMESLVARLRVSAIAATTK